MNAFIMQSVVAYHQVCVLHSKVWVLHPSRILNTNFHSISTFALKCSLKSFSFFLTNATSKGSHMSVVFYSKYSKRSLYLSLFP